MAGDSFWHKQTAGKPLFPELLWSRPENRAYAGKLLVIGGNAHGFSAPAEAFAESGKAGVGVTRVLLPDALQKTVGKVFATGEYAPSTPSGSFAQTALSEYLADSNWADGVLLAGDFGKNSETAILLEKYASKHVGQLTVTNDAIDYFITSPAVILARADTTLILTLSQLQKVSKTAHFPHAFTSDMDLLRFVETLHAFTKTHRVHIITVHLDTIFVAVNGQVSSTKRSDVMDWRTKIAARASTWWLQNPSKTFQALTTGVFF